MGAQTVKNVPVNARDLGSISRSGRSPGMVTHTSILAWRIPWIEEPGKYCPWGCRELYMTEELTHRLNETSTLTVSFNINIS